MAARDLCALADVKSYIGETSTDFDAEISRLITAASVAIHRRAGREFKVRGSNPQTRRFDLSPYRALTSHELRVGDVTSVTAVELELEDGTLVDTLDAGDYTLLPRVREESHPYTRIRFHPTVALAGHYVVAVTGDFGFPAVPEDVEQAAIAQVALWLARDVKSFSETFANAEGRLVRPRELDPLVAAVADSYRLDLLGG